MNQLRVRVPQPADLGFVIELYYKKLEIGNADIMKLFNLKSQPTARKLKRLARERMDEEDIKVWDERAVNTAAAYEAWGLDIADLERRLAKLQKLGH